MADALEMYRGDELIYDFQVTTESGGTVNLTNATILFTARTTGGSAAISAASGTAVAGTGIVITNAAAGSATLTVGTAATVGLLAPRQLHYDIEVTEQDGRRSTAADYLTILPDVTY